MASEETICLYPRFPTGKYMLSKSIGCFQISTSPVIGTIFIFRRKTIEGPGTIEDCLQPGNALVVAGYLIYGSSTMLVYSSGSGVYGFTLDPMIGEFLLTHPNIKIPKKPMYYSTNQGNEIFWSPGIQKFTRWLQGIESDHKPISQRYIGSLVAINHTLRRLLPCRYYDQLNQGYCCMKDAAYSPTAPVDTLLIWNKTY
jgi:fructose-1,6-bisphosphatase I